MPEGIMSPSIMIVRDSLPLQLSDLAAIHVLSGDWCW